MTRELVNNQAADMILEKDLTGEKLISTIDSVINDQTALQILTENAKKVRKAKMQLKTCIKKLFRC